jgi:hypothetical protein
MTVKDFAAIVHKHLETEGYGQEADVWRNLANGITGTESEQEFCENAYFDKIDVDIAQAYCKDMYDAIEKALEAVNGRRGPLRIKGRKLVK